MNTFKKLLDNIVNEVKLKNKSITTNFLTLEQQVHITDKNIDIPYHLNGGYQNPELKRLTIAPNYEFEENVSCFKILNVEPNFKLTHQNILGSLLGLGIKKDAVGDILHDQHIFFIKSELEPLIIEDFRKIGNQIISVKKISSTNIVRTINYSEFNIIVKSKRIDLVVSKITGLSRDKAQQMLDNNLIKLNHQVFTSHVKQINIDDIISIRKYGRFIVLDDLSTTKKGNIIIKIGKFI